MHCERRVDALWTQCECSGLCIDFSYTEKQATASHLSADLSVLKILGATYLLQLTIGLPPIPIDTCTYTIPIDTCTCTIPRSVNQMLYVHVAIRQPSSVSRIVLSTAMCFHKR